MPTSMQTPFSPFSIWPFHSICLSIAPQFKCQRSSANVLFIQLVKSPDPLDPTHCTPDPAAHHWMDKTSGRRHLRRHLPVSLERSPLNRCLNFIFPCDRYLQQWLDEGQSGRLNPAEFNRHSMDIEWLGRPQVPMKLAALIFAVRLLEMSSKRKATSRTIKTSTPLININNCNYFSSSEAAIKRSRRSSRGGI